MRFVGFGSLLGWKRARFVEFVCSMLGGRIVISAIVLMLFCFGGLPVRGAANVGDEPTIILLDFVPSPDGRVVAFEFMDRRAKQHPSMGIGLITPMPLSRRE